MKIFGVITVQTVEALSEYYLKGDRAIALFFQQSIVIDRTFHPLFFPTSVNNIESKIEINFFDVKRCIVTHPKVHRVNAIFQGNPLEFLKDEA